LTLAGVDVQLVAESRRLTGSPSVRSWRRRPN